MSILETLYGLSPIFFQNILVSLSGYFRNRTRYGKIYHIHRDFLKKFDRYSLEDKNEYQRIEMVRLISFANEHSSYYKELFSNIDINSIKSVSDLNKLPITDKETLRNNIDRIKTISPKKGVEGHTGGTTGKSLVVLFTREDMMKRMATLDHFKSKVGFEHLKMKRATFNGKHIVPRNQRKKIFWRYNSACKQMIYSSFHLSNENLQSYVNSLNKFKPDAIDGFFMSILDIANFIDRNRIKLDFSLVAIFPTSETITPSGKETIERVFNCKVYDQYASSEGAPFITECINQNLHIDLSTGIFEHFEDGSDEVLVTSFTTFGTPLIRYKIGDSIDFEDKSLICGCGNNSPMVRQIQGRKLDYLYSDSKAKISSVNIANGFKNIPNAIIRSQVIQNRIGEIVILLEIDKDNYKDSYDALIKNEFSQKFGNNTTIIIRHVPEIVRQQSGKLSLVVNNVKVNEDNF